MNLHISRIISIIRIPRVAVVALGILIASLLASDYVSIRGNYFLDIATATTDRDILYIYVDSDNANGFDIHISFPDGVGLTHTKSSAEKEFTSLKTVVPSTDGLADGLSISSEEVMGIDSLNAGKEFILSTTGTVTSGSTTGFLIKVVGSWSGSNSMLAGFYKGKITVTIAAQ